MFDKQDFFAKSRNFKREPFELEGVGSMYVREVSAKEAKEFASKQKQKPENNLEHSAWLAVRVLCDADGARVFEDKDAEEFSSMPLRVLKAIGEAAAKVSGWDKGNEESGKNGESA